MIADSCLKSAGVERGEELPAFAWPGGYPLVYLLADGEILCPDCANGKNGSEAITADADDPGWHVIDCEVCWEGEVGYCAHCNGDIESAYGPVAE